MSIKTTLTKQVISNLPSDQIDLELAMRTWWTDFRSGGGSRLTVAGYNAFCQVGIASWCFDVPLGFLTKPWHLLILDKKITCPYFLQISKKPQIVLFGSEAAMMLALYQDPEKWVAFLQQT